MSLTASRPSPPVYPSELKTLGDHVRKKRLDLGLLQREVAGLLGIDEATVYNWENNRSSPSLHLIPKVIEFLGYLPFSAEGRGLGERIVWMRRAFGIRQDELARKLGVDPSTLARWEQGNGQPLKKHMEKIRTLLTDDLPHFEGH